MKNSQSLSQAFLNFALDCGALQFGKFTLKSGRLSPYFFNTGVFTSGNSLQKLGKFYATAIVQAMDKAELDFDMIFGSAYKGIPLACTTAISLHTDFQIEKPFAFDRKEIKDHGEGGNIVGASLQGRVLIVDDVISAGITVNQSCALLRSYKAQPVAVMIAFDREEKGNDAEQTTQEQISAQNNIDIFSIAKFSDLVSLLKSQDDGTQDHLQQILEYQAQNK